MKSLFLFLIVLFSGVYFDRLNIFRICILSSFLHEIGHIAAYRCLMGKMPKITVSVFGIKMKNNVSYSKYYPFIIVCGPLINLFLVIFSLFSINKSAAYNKYIWLYVNTILFFLNTLPVWFLDGGQFLYHFSRFYQRNYMKISIFTVVALSVMLMYFTGIKIYLVIFLIYFIINISNHI